MSARAPLTSVIAGTDPACYHTGLWERNVILEITRRHRNRKVVGPLITHRLST